MGKEALGKGAMAALGALGGLSEDPADLYSFVNATGSTGLQPGQGPTSVSVDPGDALAGGLARNDLIFDAIAGSATPSLGPAAMIQQAPFSFGGALPSPIGVGIADVGWRQPEQMSIYGQPSGGDGGNYGKPPGLRSPEDGGRRRPPEALTYQPGGTGTLGGSGGGGDSITPADRGGRGPGGTLGMAALMESPSSFAQLMMAPSSAGMPGMMPTQTNDFQGFLDAVNLLQLAQRSPIVPGGLV